MNEAKATVKGRRATGAGSAPAAASPRARKASAPTPEPAPSFDDVPAVPEGNLALGEVATVWDPLRRDEAIAEDGESADGKAPRRRRAAPFVKWAGGKRGLLHEMGRRLPGHIENYYEPMVGGGALFFALADAGLIHGRAVLIDPVPELMIAYRIIRDQVDDLIVALEAMDKRHTADSEAGITGAAHYYYTVRDQGIPALANELAVAARFIYLNRTCYNGLYRVNARGKFNVPMGRYKNPRILDAAGLRAASRALNATNALLLTADFGVLTRADGLLGRLEAVELQAPDADMRPVTGDDGEPLVFDGIDELIAYLNSPDEGRGPIEVRLAEHGGSTVKGSTVDGLLVGGVASGLTAAEWASLEPSAGDFVYFDPPYIPLVKTSFTRYTAPSFTMADQERLRDAILELTRRGVAVMASNSSAAEALDLYDDPVLTVETVEAPRAVNSRVEGRGPVNEILVTNYAPGSLGV